MVTVAINHNHDFFVMCGCIAARGRPFGDEVKDKLIDVIKLAPSIVAKKFVLLVIL